MAEYKVAALSPKLGPQGPVRPKFRILPLSDEAKGLYKPSGPSAAGDSGVDLRFPTVVKIAAGATKTVGLGVRVWCEFDARSIPFFVLPRSSLGKTPLIAEEKILPIAGAAADTKQSFHIVHMINDVIPTNPKEIAVTLTNHGSTEYTIEAGIALFQLVETHLRVPEVTIVSGWNPAPVNLESPPETSFSFIVCPLRPMSVGEPRVGRTSVFSLPHDVVCASKSTTDISLGVRICCEEDHTGAFWGYWMMPFFEDTPLMMKNWVGVIDSGYRGELKAKVYNRSSKPYTILATTPIFGMLPPMRQIRSLTFVDSDDERFATDATLRGAGGFGSTGLAGKT